MLPGWEYRQEAGRELLIPCAAAGDPFPSITWRKVCGLTDADLQEVGLGRQSIILEKGLERQCTVLEKAVSKQCMF